MNKTESIFSKFDHTVLAVCATEDDVKKACGLAVKYNTASVCVPPCYVSDARKAVGNKINVTTVISFPSGNAATAVKVFECKDAIRNGADELDVVANLGMIKGRRYDELENELTQLRNACKNQVLKIIIEAPLLTGDEQIAVAAVATSAGVDYVKTCTGFGTAATGEDVTRLVKNVGDNVKIKASGGIKTLADAEKFIALGADRIGESGLIPPPDGE